MKEVVLTVGPQWSGKSTFCKKIIQAHQDIRYISRDAILIEMYGVSPHLLSSEDCVPGLEKMYDRLQEEIERPGDRRIILDCWCPTSIERKKLIERSRFFGADSIGAWHFITPEEKCLEWCEAKYGQFWKMIMATNRFSYQQFADEIRRSEGLNFIKKINPLEPPCFVHLFSPLVPSEQIPLKI